MLDKRLLMGYNAAVVDRQVASARILVALPKTAPSSTFDNLFRIRTSEKCVRNSFGIRTYKSKALKVLYNPHLQETGGEGRSWLTSALDAA